eukprot:1454979-Rhodomonas_salina.1
MATKQSLASRFTHVELVFLGERPPRSAVHPHSAPLTCPSTWTSNGSHHLPVTRRQREIAVQSEMRGVGKDTFSTKVKRFFSLSNTTPTASEEHRRFCENNAQTGNATDRTDSHESLNEKTKLRSAHPTRMMTPQLRSLNAGTHTICGEQSGNDGIDLAEVLGVGQVRR